MTFGPNPGDNLSVDESTRGSNMSIEIYTVEDVNGNTIWNEGMAADRSYPEADSIALTVSGVVVANVFEFTDSYAVTESDYRANSYGKADDNTEYWSDGER